MQSRSASLLATNRPLIQKSEDVIDNARSFLSSRVQSLGTDAARVREEERKRAQAASTPPPAASGTTIKDRTDGMLGNKGQVRDTGIENVPPAQGKSVPSTAIQQGASAKAHGGEAKTARSDDTAVAQGRRVFDTPGDRSAKNEVDVRGMKDVGKAPAAVRALQSHIPEKARNDKVIQNQVAWYAARESAKADTRAKLAKVNKDIETRNGDPAVLNAYNTQLGNELKQILSDQQTAQTAIKKQLVNLGMAWVESPPANAAK